MTDTEEITGLPMPDNDFGMPANPYLGDETVLPEPDPEEDPEADRDAFEALIGDAPKDPEVEEAEEILTRLSGEEKEEEEPAQEKQLSPEEIEQRAKAFQALQRAQLDVDDFASEEKAIAKGLSLAESQKKTDEMIGDLRGKIRESKEVSADPGLAVAPGQTGGPTLQKLKDVLKEEFGQETADKIAPLMAPDLSGVEKELETVTSWMQSMIVEGFRSKDDRLDEDGWAKVQPQFELLAKSEGYGGPDGLRKALDHATRIVFGAPPTPDQVRERSEIAEAKAKGRPTSTNRKEPAKKLSSEEREYQEYLEAFKLSERAMDHVFGRT